jgi:hypothetical protein
MLMTRTRAVVLTLGLGLGLGSCAPAARAQSPLRWKFQAGETLRYEFQQLSEFKVKVNNQETTNATDLTIELSWKVKRVADDGVAEITQTVDRARVKIQAGPQKIAYDSKDGKTDDNPSAQALSQVYAAAVGQEYSLKISPRGEVLDAKVPDSVTNALRGSPFQASADGGGVLSAVGLKNMFAQVFPVLPPEVAGKGKTWDSTLVLPTAPLVTTLKTTYTLAGLDETSAKIDSAIEAAIKSGPEIPFTINLRKQTGTGTFLFDRDPGRLTEAKIHQSMELLLGFMNREIEQSIGLDLRLKRLP